ncbi:TetR family transcriptional regulator [Nocardia cyriacigeorgica]|nr:TetR family transcriptional regulator [Nocardia cyriacigeorgica]MBF6162747.1 TetR family transcriptional regulator [Nocardia cyriacigeorgica]MBF6201747.1 TetR family transcriptional regulator [Nocardia cyriacigeorgica]MBF6320636.1 TetR family transcriptional regulator [Nocardia cyriacigeorgica]MBF6398876.1 TetR family transcriptional regulator [Nocardia cyriacigeorgica]
MARNTPRRAKAPAVRSAASKRELVLDAAIGVLGARGPRALTHRAVDEAAGVPTGTTSNYFRTREALLVGVTERLEQRDYADWAALTDAPGPDSVDALAADLTRFVMHAATADRTRTLARYALLLEAQTAPALLESLRRGHLRLTEWAGTMLGGLGADASVTTAVVDYLDGVIMHRLGAPRADEDPRPQMRRMLAALIGPPETEG